MGEARRLWERGNRLFDRGEVELAIDCFTRAAGIDPGLAEAFNSLGVAHYERKQYQRAIPPLQKAVLLKPDFSEALNNLAVCYLFLGRLHDAATAFEKVVEIVPRFAEAHNNLGLVYEQLGMTDRALAHYRAFVDAWTGNRRYTLAARERIDRLTQGRSSGVSEPAQTLDRTAEEDDAITLSTNQERSDP